MMAIRSRFLSPCAAMNFFRFIPLRRFHAGDGKPPSKEENPVIIYFAFTKAPENDRVETYAREGESLLQVAHNNNVELEGACESSLACSTCHVILDKKIFEALPEACEEEEDLLDLAYGLTHTSRLGCQVKVTREMSGMTVKLPSATRNFYVDKSKLPK